MHFFPFESETIQALYDPIKQVLILLYQGAVTAQHTAVYEWLVTTCAHVPYLSGLVLDLRLATRLDADAFTGLAARYEALNALHRLDALPIALMTSNPLIERQAQAATHSNPVLHHKRLVHHYADAWATFAADPRPRPAVDARMLDIPTASAWWDEATRIAYIFYYGVLDSATTGQAYEWVMTLPEHTDFRTMRGGIYDFRMVEVFDKSNLGAVRRTSTMLNTSYNLNHVAIALLVANFQQEQTVRIAQSLTPQETRKRIVHRYAEADAFIEAYAQSYAAHNKPRD